MGSYCGRVRQFLASVVPQHDGLPGRMDSAVRLAGSAEQEPTERSAHSADVAVWAVGDGGQPASDDGWRPARGAALAVRPETSADGLAASGVRANSSDQQVPSSSAPLVDWQAIVGRTRPEQGKTLLAVIGAAAIFLRIRRARLPPPPPAKA